MVNYRITRPAARDIEQIWTYITEDNPGAAEHLIDGLHKLLAVIASNPLMGFARSDLRPRLRSFSYRSYIIFYQPIEGGVEVIRVLHGYRDIETEFE